jgi:hypothetical protein
MTDPDGLDGEYAAMLNAIRLRAAGDPGQRDETCWRFLCHLRRTLRDVPAHAHADVTRAEVDRFGFELRDTYALLDRLDGYWTRTGGVDFLPYAHAYRPGNLAALTSLERPA